MTVLRPEYSEFIRHGHDLDRPVCGVPESSGRPRPNKAKGAFTLRERLSGFPYRALRRNFRPWLAPEQVHVLKLNDDEKLVASAKEIHRELRANEVRAETDFSPDPIKARISEAEKAKVHTMLVISGRDLEARAVSVHLHDNSPLGAKPKVAVMAAWPITAGAGGKTSSIAADPRFAFRW